MTNWLIDFDDCLATGPITWALRHAIPALISGHHLPYNPLTFNQTILRAQQQANIRPESEGEQVMSELFDALGWPHDLQGPLQETIYTKYQPELFDDSLPFLERLQTRGHKMFVASNNKHAPYLTTMLKIDHFFTGMATAEGKRPKPAPDLWEALVAQFPQINATNAVVVGDDPWSDGTFAESCHIPCYILDREQRFTTLTLGSTITVTASLLDIPIG